MTDQDPSHAAAALPRPGRALRRWLWWDVVFLSCALAIGTVRFLILRHGGAPPTVDAGNWLALADGMLGHGVRSSTVVYPPLVPLLTKASAAALGLTNGVALVAAVSSLAPAVGVYVALRSVGLAGASVTPALLVLGASSVGEATAWGGFPQLIGLGLTPVALVLFDRLWRTWSIPHALAAGVALMAILATSHFVGTEVVLALGAMLVAGLLLPLGPAPGWWRRVGRLGLVVLPSVWLVPLYWSLARVYGGDPAIGVSPNRLTWANLLEHIEFLYRDTPWLWRILLPMAIIAPFVLWRSHRSALWRVTSSLLLITVVLTVVTREDRFLYTLAPLAALGLALWVVRGLEILRAETPRDPHSVRPARWVAGISLAVLLSALGFQFARSTEFFQVQRNWYGILTPGLVHGIEYLRDSSAPGTLVAVPSLNNAPLGWWVEAIAQRPTIYGSPLGWLVFDDEIERASFANDLFVPRFPTTAKIESARNAGIELILLPTMWTFYDDAAVNAIAREAPAAVLQLNSDAVVIRPGALGL